MFSPIEKCIIETPEGSDLKGSEADESIILPAVNVNNVFQILYYS